MTLIEGYLNGYNWSLAVDLSEQCVSDTIGYLEEDQFTDSFVEYYCGSYHVYYLGYHRGPTILNYFSSYHFYYFRGYHRGLLQLLFWTTTS